MTLKERFAAWYITRRIGKAAGLTRKERKQMLDLIKKLLGASWLVTVLGWVATYLGVTSTVGWFKPDGTVNWMGVALGIVGAVLFRVTKQSNVTGGSIPATLEAVKRIETPAPAEVMFTATPKDTSKK
jgi:hypothetical protein